MAACKHLHLVGLVDIRRRARNRKQARRRGTLQVALPSRAVTQADRDFFELQALYRQYEDPD